MRCIMFSFIFSIMFTLTSQAMTEPESSSQPQPPTPMIIDVKEVVHDEKTCFICKQALNDKCFEFLCTLQNQTHTIHEFCLREWLVARKKFICPICKQHDIPTPYRNDNTNWDPSPEELFDKYKMLLPALGLGVIIQMLLSR